MRRTVSAPTRALIAGLFAVVIVAPFAGAHGDVHQQIFAVTDEIARAPSAALFLKRGRLYHEHEDYAQALADYDHAFRREPGLGEIWFARGLTCFKAGRLDAALDAANTFLRQQPAHADALLLRARIQYAQKNYAAAVADFDRNFALTPDPVPECVLERTAALAAAGEPARALAGLDAAMQRRGNLVTLQQAAIELELQLGRPAAALARVDRVLAGLNRREAWLLRRGEILESAGRTDEARQAYAAAHAQIERLAPHLRSTPSTQELDARLRAKLHL